MAAAFVAADGFFISYSRVGLMDGILTSLLLWCMLAAVSARTWRGVLVTALLVGIAVSVKWSGVFIVIPAAVTMLLLGRVRFWSLFIFAVVPVVQTAVWLLALRLSHEPTDLASLWRLVKESGAPSRRNEPLIQSAQLVLVHLAHFLPPGDHQEHHARGIPVLLLHRRQPSLLDCG